MKLENLKRIAAARTKGEWKAWGPEDNDGSGVSLQSVANYRAPDFFVGTMTDVDDIENGSVSLSFDDAEFIATAANTYDALIEIAEAAKDYEDHLPNLDPSFGASKYSTQLRLAMRLREALSKLTSGGEAT